MTSCEYFVVQYVPFPREQLRLPIGLILMDGKGHLVRHGITRDWRAVRCVDSCADLNWLESLPAYFDSVLRELPGMPSRHVETNLADRLAGMMGKGFGPIRISPQRGVETEDPLQEFDRLFDEHVSIRPLPSSRPPARPGSRRWIHTQLKQALEQAPFWQQLRSNVSVEEFTAPGDRFEIDFAYQPNGVTKYLHAVSLERDWNQAKVLSYTFSRIRARRPAVLTAIVADDGTREQLPQSCRKILEDAEIALHPVEALDGLLDQMGGDFGPVI